MNNRSAYLLVVHGSRNFNYGKQLCQLANSIQSRLHDRNLSIPFTTAYLELSQQPLHQKIAGFAREYALKGYQSIKILPLFLLSGTHVINDIPDELSLAQVDSPLKLELMSHIGSSPSMITLLRSQLASVESEGKIIFAHGTSLEGGNQKLETIARQLGSQVSYWAHEPYFVDTVKQVISSKVAKVAILPYFLFTGKITDTMTMEISYQQSESATQITYLPTLAQTNEFIDLIIQQMIDP